MKKTLLGSLQEKFANSGVKGEIISDRELHTLYKKLKNLADYFDDRGDKSLHFVFMIEADEVERVINERKNNW